MTEPEKRPAAYRHPQTPEETGFFFVSGKPVAPTHPDHGPMDRLPRQENGGFPAYYYCSREELEGTGIWGKPPAVRERHDGWNYEKIAEFITQLRATASVTDACRAVSMSRQSAYNLYHGDDSGHIRDAWDEALKASIATLATTAFDRAVNGHEERVFHKGEFVGWQTKYNYRHLQWLLRVRDPLNWAPLSEIEGWLKTRGGETQAEPLPQSLDRLAAAEEKWGRKSAVAKGRLRGGQALPPKSTGEEGPQE